MYTCLFIYIYRIDPCPCGFMRAPECQLSSDVLMVHAQVDHIVDKLAPLIKICTVAGLILLGLLLFVIVSWFAP
jgi:hypothetical protein